MRKDGNESWIVWIDFCWARPGHQGLKLCKGPVVSEGRAGGVRSVGRLVGLLSTVLLAGDGVGWGAVFVLRDLCSAWLALGET